MIDKNDFKKTVGQLTGLAEHEESPVLITTKKIKDFLEGDARIKSQYVILEDRKPLVLACRKCLKTKSVEEFASTNRPNVRFRRDAYCKICRQEIKKKKTKFDGDFIFL